MQCDLSRETARERKSAGGMHPTSRKMNKSLSADRAAADDDDWDVGNAVLLRLVGGSSRGDDVRFGVEGCACGHKITWRKSEMPVTCAKRTAPMWTIRRSRVIFET